MHNLAVVNFTNTIFKNKKSCHFINYLHLVVLQSCYTINALPESVYREGLARVIPLQCFCQLFALVYNLPS